MDIKSPHSTSQSKNLDGNLGDFNVKTFIQAKFPSIPFSEELLQYLLSICTIKQYAKQDVVLTNGQFNQSLYIIIHGELSVYAGDSILFDLDSSGDVLGEISVLTGILPTETVIAKSFTSLLVIPRLEALDGAASDTSSSIHKFYQLLAYLLAERLKWTTRRAGKLERQNSELSTDSLTQCWNRNRFFADLDKGRGFTLIYIKVDKFNEINDGLGFEAGNEVLVQTARIVQNVLPATANLYRFSGSEFGILCIMDNPTAYQLCEKIKDHISFSKLIYGNSRIVITMSMGIADAASGDIFKNAHTALGESKRSGKIIIYTPDLNVQNQFIESLQQFKIVQEAFEENMFFPVYQGIRDNRKDSPHYGKLHKFECLIRLQMGEKELSPFFFLKALERSGEITRATKLMIMKSFEQMQITDYEFSINLTEKDLLDDSLLGFIIFQLQGNKIAANRVTFEILEGVGSLSSKSVVSTLHQIKALGCKVAIDDFGAEQSNISRLLEFEPDYIKIDAKFIKNLPNDKKSRIIVENVYDLATRMDAEVVAEFVASEEIQAIVEDIGIHFSQGFLFSKPHRNPGS